MAIEVDASTIALFKFNETSVPGTGYATAVDSGASGRNLSETAQAGSGYSRNYTHIVNGPAGRDPGSYARFFPGLGARLQNSSVGAACITLFTGSWSAEVWICVKADPGTAGYIFAFGGNAETQAFNVLGSWFVASNVSLGTLWEQGAGVNVATNNGVVLTLGVWYHAAVTVDNSGGTATVKHYLNGALVNTTSGLTKTTGGTSNTTIKVGSADDSGFLFIGALKSLKLSSVVRSAAEIAADYARTDYQHVVDADTFALRQFNEEPDAFEETDYGYHARKIAGSILIVDPLAPDGGQARFLDASTEYNCHDGFEPMRSMLVSGIWTYDTWVRMNTGYNGADRGFWVYGDPGPETLPDNFLSCTLTTSRRLSIFEEYGNGLDAGWLTTNPIFATVGDGYNRHYIVVVHNGLNVKLYIDGVLVDDHDNTHLYEGGTISYLRLGSGYSISINPVLGSFDNSRWRNIAATQEQIIADYNAEGGSTPNYGSAAGYRRYIKYGWRF